MIKKELKITVEALTSCAANCSGCFLTPEMRSASNLWDEKKRQLAGVFIKDFIDYHESISSVDEIGLNFGQGDFLQLNDKSIKDLMSDIASWTNSRACVFFTASGVTNRDRLKKSVDLFHELSIQNKHPLLFDLVIDSSKLGSNFLSIYQENIKYIREVFGYVDLNMNMGIDVVRSISPQDFSDMLLKNQVEFITLNFIPAPHMNLSKDDFGSILSWLEMFSKISKDLPYKVNFHQTLLINYKNSQDLNVSQMNALLNDVYAQEIFIDYDGNLFVQHEGIGDTPLTSRTGYAPVINVFEYDNKKMNMADIIAKIQSYGSNLNKEIFKQFNAASSCSDCEFKNTCMKSGVDSMKKAIGFDKKSHSCSLGMTGFIDFIIKEFNEKIVLDDFKGVYHQRSLQNEVVKMKLQSMNFKDDFKF